MSDGSYRFMTYWNESCATIDLNATAGYSNDSITTEHQDCSFFTGFSDLQGGPQLPFALLDVWQSGVDALSIPASGQECSLSLCVRSYSNVTAINGTLQLGNATIVGNLTTTIDMSHGMPPEHFPFPYNATVMLQTHEKSANETVYTVDTTTLGRIAAEVFDLFLPENSKSDPAWLNSFDTWTDQHWLLGDFSTGYATLVSDMLDDVANAITVTMRNGPGNTYDRLTAQGTTWVPVVFISVQWLWLVYPAAIIAIAVAFVAATIFQTSRSELPAWKSSTLANIYHGPQLDEFADATALDYVSVMEKEAAGYTVRLRRSETGRLGLLLLPSEGAK